MVNLLLVVLSIALLSALTAISIGHVPAAALQRQVLHKETTTGLRLLHNATVRYFETHRDADNKVIYPGANIDMMPLLVPAYGFMPANVRSTFTWEAGTGYLFGLPASYICVKPLNPVSADAEMMREVLKPIRANSPLGSAYMATVCGSNEDSPGGTYLTVWLILSHYDGPPPPPPGSIDTVPEAAPQ